MEHIYQMPSAQGSEIIVEEGESVKISQWMTPRMECLLDTAEQWYMNAQYL